MRGFGQGRLFFAGVKEEFLFLRRQAIVARFFNLIEYRIHLFLVAEIGVAVRPFFSTLPSLLFRRTVRIFVDYFRTSLLTFEQIGEKVGNGIKKLVDRNGPVSTLT